MLVHETSDLIHQLEEILNRSHGPVSESHGVLITKKKLKEVIDLLHKWDYELTNFSLALARVQQQENMKTQQIDLHIEYRDLLDENQTIDVILNNIITQIRMNLNENYME